MIASCPLPPLLLMRGLTVRYNPRYNPMVNCLAGEDVLGGVLRLRGFAPDTGKVMQCRFIVDEEVQEGQIVLEPFTSLDAWRVVPEPPVGSFPADEGND